MQIDILMTGAKKPKKKKNEKRISDPGIYIYYI